MDIKELAKKLCDESGCHHKCKEIDECVVMEEAEELLISQDKSNNFDVKSNEELFKQALVEGLNRRFDREIEEAKKIEQIEEMGNDLKIAHDEQKYLTSDKSIKAIATTLYNAGYRKQSEGEWITHTVYYECSLCHHKFCFAYKHCPNCAAKMRGENNG